jgi:arginine-tRNA-protein transferase
MVHISTIKSEALDRFLAAGWYRMHHTMFTTNFINQDDPATRVFWLRYHVGNIRLAKHKQLLRRNAEFSATYRGLVMTDELNELYSAYHNNVDHECSDNLQGVLGVMEKPSFDSYLIEVRHKHKLIAAGIFDKGKESIAGIVNFYHPDYKKYSLGKYLMLLKVQYCRDHQLEWYYPGYFGANLPKFAYKLFVDKNATEVFIPEIKQWISYADFTTVI